MNDNIQRVQRGFTLIELVIAMAVVGVLASVALPRMLDTSEAARKVAAEASADAVKTGYSALVGKNSETSPRSPWPTLLGMTGGTAGGFGNTSYAVGWLGSGQQVASTPTFHRGGGATPNLTSCDNAAVASLTGIDWVTWYTRITTADYSYNSFSMPAGSCEFINAPGIPHSGGTTYVVPGSPDVPGSLPLAADKSGVCVTAGWKLETYRDGPSTAPTSASSDLVKSLGGRPVQDQINCPLAAPG